MDCYITTAPLNIMPKLLLLHTTPHISIGYRNWLGTWWLACLSSTGLYAEDALNALLSPWIESSWQS